MAATYGEQLLAQAEGKRRVKAARRRLVRVFAPSAVVIIWAMLDLLSGRGARLDEIEAGAIRTFFDHIQVIGWTTLFVLLPLAGALKPEPLPSGAALAWFAGPVLSPVLFGAGGWTKWQMAFMTLIVAMILVGQRVRALHRRND